MASLNIISYNVRGLRSQIKRRKIMRYLNERKFDVIFVQETHSTVRDCSLWENEWGGKMYCSHGESNSKGVGIWLRKNTKIKVLNRICDDQGRYIVLNIEYEGSKYTLVNLYAPNVDSLQFFKMIFRQMETIPNDYKIIGGDFNLILDSNLDLWGAANGAHANAETATFVKQYMYNEGLIDVWRENHSQEKQFTYKKQHPPYFARLDFFLVSKTLTPFIQSSEIKSRYLADHSTPTISVAPNLTPRGKGYWKLNANLLNDKKYVEEINNLIDEVISVNHGSTKLTWEMVKMKVRGFTISYSTFKKKEAEKTLTELEQKLEKIEKDIIYSQDKDAALTEAASLRSSISDLEEQKTRASMFRARKNWVQYAEKNSAYFFALEKQNYNRKCISKLKLSNGQVSTDFKTILSEQH